MLLHLHIKNFAIVPELDQDFYAGFTAISGETGAGKSIMVDALGLLLGDRSDSSWVRAGEQRAELSAEFAVTDNAQAQDWLQSHDLDEGEHCLLRRTIQANGRSRAWVNGSPVTISQLAELGNLLVEVHGQNEHIRLTGQARQLALLDQSGDYAAQLSKVVDSFNAWSALNDEFEQLKNDSALPPGDAEFMRFQLDELNQAALSAEAVEALEKEHRLLSSSGDFLKALDESQAVLADNDVSASHFLSKAHAALLPYRELDPVVAEVLGMLNEAQINTDEAFAALQGTAASMNTDPDRFKTIEQTLSTLAGLARKHGSGIDELETVRDELTARLDRAANASERLKNMTADLQKCEQDWRTGAKNLSKARRKHAETLSKAAQTLMQELGMEGGQLIIAVSSSPEAGPAANGLDQISINVSANAGMPPAPLSKVASGGELSRISLAIKVATAGRASRTQVFDEIDTGVGGATANTVGQLLSRVAYGGQALCVTHLAQVAVRADQQLKVMKHSSGESTSIEAGVLDEAGRIDEIARMLGGSQSDQSRAHAQEMLESARSTLQ